MRPTLITLTLAVPTASYALGLGDIHVESALHQPLIAQIELVGAVDEDLGRLSASLASDELFQKYNLERAAFIFGTKLTVGRDAQGRPVLNMRSIEKFTEPVVTVLVDLHTPGGELVREYTLFLDPPGLVANAGVESAAPASAASDQHEGTAAMSNASADQHQGTASTVSAGAPTLGHASSANAKPDLATPDLATFDHATADHAASAPASAQPHGGVTPNKLLGQTYKVARRDTLAQIATAAGARSRTEQHRLMIAIYRANPAAFQNNFSRMHTGVTLTIPTAEQLAAIPVEDTNREYDRQMAEWRASLHHGATSAARRANSPNTSSTPAAPASANSTPAVPAAPPSANSTPAAPAAPPSANSTPAAPAASSTPIAPAAPTSASSIPIAPPTSAKSTPAATANASAANRIATGSGAGSAAAKAAAASLANASLANASLDADTESQPTDRAALTQRIATLEHSLAAIQQELKRPLPVQPAAVAAPATAANASAANRIATGSGAGSAAAKAAATTRALRDASIPSAAATAADSAAHAHAAAAPAMTNTAAAIAAPVVSDEESSDDDVDDAPRVKHHGLELLAAAVGFSLVFFAGAWVYLRRRSAHAYTMTPRYPVAPIVEVTSKGPESEIIVEETHEALEVVEPAAVKTAGELQSRTQATANDPKSESSWFEDSFSTPIADLLSDPTVSLAVEDTAKLPFDTIEPTVKLPKAPPSDQTSDTEVLVAPELEFAGDTVEQKFSFFNPEATTNTEHVVMDGVLTETKPFVERRKNPADVLRQAIEREPERTDLRLKLLELYYTAAAENRRAFLDATRQLSKIDILATPEDWNRIADMGRIIAPDDELFSSDVDVDDDKRVA